MSRQLNSRLDRIRQASKKSIAIPSTIEVSGYDEPTTYYTLENGKERLMTDQEIFYYQSSSETMSNISVTIGEWIDIE